MLIPSEQLCVVHYGRAEADLPTLPKVSKLHILLAAQISETC
jgi:hypothetical protein